MPTSSTPTRSSRFLKVVLGCLLLLALLAAFCVWHVGRWLVVQDALQKAQAIVVLSGRMPVRALGAADLYRRGWAPQVWLTKSAEPGRTLAELNIPYEGEEFYNTQVLVHQGVPADAIHVLANPIVDTADEIAEIAARLPADGTGGVIIVTSKVHTRRVRVLWRRLGRGRAIVRAADEDPFEPDRWWRTSGEALDVVRECLGLLNAWAGLPLHGS
jgi:uncharacterized SAM-binding protein YcdF (DUF218 family)